MRPRQYGRYFPDDIFLCIFLNENVGSLIKISLKFVSKGPINNISSLVQIMAWHRAGGRPLFEAMMAYFTDTYMQHSASMSWKQGISWPYTFTTYAVVIQKNMQTVLLCFDFVWLHHSYF